MGKRTANRSTRTARSDAASPSPSTVARADGWVNVVTALGMRGRDKTVDAVPVPEFMDQMETENWWRADDMAARVVEVIPDEMTREGFTINIGSLDPDEDDPTASGVGENSFTNDSAADLPAAPPAEGSPAPANGAPRGPAGTSGAFPAMPKEPDVGELPDVDDSGKQAAEELLTRLERLEASEACRTALEYERAHGGGAILIGANDGQTFDKPLDLTNIQSVDFLTVLSPRECFAVAYYNDIGKPKYGMPAIYRIVPDAVGTAWKPGPTTPFMFTEVHESRIIAFRGLRVSRRQLLMNRSWGDSVFIRMKRVLSQFGQSWQSAAVLLADFAQAVYKIDGLAELIEGDENDVLLKRITAMDMTRSAARAIFIDKEEDFTRQATPVTGMPELLDRFCNRLAAAADMPVTRLMGQAPAGLNATGDANTRNWYDHIRAKQKNKLQPALKYLIKILMLAADSPTDGAVPKVWDIQFNALWQLTDLEKAQLRYQQAQVDQIEINTGMISPEEATASRHGSGQWSADTVIDFEGRKSMAANYQKEKDAAVKAGANPSGTLPQTEGMTPPPKTNNPVGGTTGEEESTPAAGA